MTQENILNKLWWMGPQTWDNSYFSDLRISLLTQPYCFMLKSRKYFFSNDQKVIVWYQVSWRHFILETRLTSHFIQPKLYLWKQKICWHPLNKIFSSLFGGCQNIFLSLHLELNLFRLSNISDKSIFEHQISSCNISIIFCVIVTSKYFIGFVFEFIETI